LLVYLSKLFIAGSFDCRFHHPHAVLVGKFAEYVLLQEFVDPVHLRDSLVKGFVRSALICADADQVIVRVVNGKQVPQLSGASI
jgi:hypothetical protein